MDRGDEITRLLRGVAAGDRAAEETLIDALYEELRHIARLHMRKERLGHTLQPTALVNQAYARLMHGTARDWNNRVHFMAAASTVMRRILVDHARRRRAAKRGDGTVPVDLPDLVSDAGHSPEVVLAVDEALADLMRQEPRQARVVELRFFGGLTNEEIAAQLGVSPRTVKREWVAAKAWLYRRLETRV